MVEVRPRLSLVSAGRILDLLQVPCQEAWWRMSAREPTPAAMERARKLYQRLTKDRGLLMEKRLYPPASDDVIPLLALALDDFVKEAQRRTSLAKVMILQRHKEA